MYMNKIILSLFVAFVLVIGAGTVSAAGGFNEFGYNYDARIFNGLADGVDKVLDGNVWGSPTYANDHVVMKWNEAWDNCNAVRTPENCKGAWTDNEWSGKTKDGSGEVWHYKIVWIGNYTTNPELVPEGAYGVWGEYAVIMDQGNGSSGHVWYAHGIPAGYGAY